MYSHEGYRPLGRLEKERWKRIHAPRAWEYQILTPEELARNRAPVGRPGNGRSQHNGRRSLEAGASGIVNELSLSRFLSGMMRL